MTTPIGSTVTTRLEPSVKSRILHQYQQMNAEGKLLTRY